MPPAERAAEVSFTVGYPGGADVADHLLALYLSGTKVAGSSLLEDFTTSGDRVPQVGDCWIVLAGDGSPGCILRTRRVETSPFAEVSAEVALAEGEGDLSLEHWKRVHAEAYAPHLAAWGLSSIESATVVTEFFEVVFRGA